MNLPARLRGLWRWPFVERIPFRTRPRTAVSWTGCSDHDDGVALGTSLVHGEGGPLYDGRLRSLAVDANDPGFQGGAGSNGRRAAERPEYVAACCQRRGLISQLSGKRRHRGRYRRSRAASDGRAVLLASGAGAGCKSDTRSPRQGRSKAGWSQPWGLATCQPEWPGPSRPPAPAARAGGRDRGVSTSGLATPSRRRHGGPAARYGVTGPPGCQLRARGARWSQVSCRQCPFGPPRCHSGAAFKSSTSHMGPGRATAAICGSCTLLPLSARGLCTDPSKCADFEGHLHTQDAVAQQLEWIGSITL